MSLEVKLIILVTFLIGVIFYLLSRKPEQKSNSGELKMLQDQIMHMNKMIEVKLGESNNHMQRNFATNTKISSESTKKIEEITKKLSSLEETNKQIQDI
jgi:hypothetical protein|tara:strand:- start:291 stop:587 length:297 start_codon:yes stop_codon:yes gene_type:complete